MAAVDTKILFMGGTGYFGKFLVDASAKAGHPTFVLVRDSTLSNPAKAHLIDKFKSLGVHVVLGDLYNHESLVKAIKEAGNVKRFFPSEFGNDVDRDHAVDPAKTVFETKIKIRNSIEAGGIPHTYVLSNFFSGYFLPSLSQPGAKTPPRDKLSSYPR